MGEFVLNSGGVVQIVTQAIKPAAIKSKMPDWEKQLLEKQGNVKKKEKKVAGYSQWRAASSGAFSPTGQTVPVIEPGYYDLSASNDGLFFVPVRPRTEDLLQFADSASLSVLESITDFWGKEELFYKYDVPFKRGVLLYGPPGSGKSCTLQLVARDVVDRGGIVINYPGDSSLFIACYRALRDIQPSIPVVVLMEDFELFLGHGESRLLNLLDGVEKLDRVVFLATTNYPERLQERIVNRPSRFDIRVRVDHPSAAMRRQYLEHLVKPDDKVDIEAYVRDSAGKSLAHLKELFVATHLLGNDYAETVKRINSMKEKVTSLDTDPFGELEDEAVGNYM